MPKDGKKGKKSKKGGDDKKGKDPAEAEVKVVEKPTLKEIELSEKVYEVSELTHEYASQIDALQNEARKRDEDTLDMVHYLEQEVRRKQHANAKLQKHLLDLEARQLEDRIQMKEMFKKQLKEAEEKFLDEERRLLTENGQLRKDVEALGEYKKMRTALALELEQTKKNINDNERRHRQQLDDLERKFLAARDRLEKEAAERIAVSRKVYKEEVGLELDADSKRVREENKKMERELTKQEHTTDQLQKENLQLQQSIKKLRINLDLTQQKGKEYIKRHNKQNGNVGELKANVKKYETVVTKLLRGVETEREARRQKQELEVSKLSAELEQLEQMGEERDTEMRTLRVHANTILTQRKEVERYFLDAIAEAAQNQREFRKKKLEATKVAHNRQMRHLAGGEKGAIGDNHLPPVVQGILNSNPYEVDGVDLRYDSVYRLTGMVRLQLLRLLYAKISNAKSAQQTVHRPHSFAIDIDASGQVIPISQLPNRRKKAPRKEMLMEPEKQQLAFSEGDGNSFFITDGGGPNEIL